MRPQSILSLRGAADLDKREQVRVCYMTLQLILSSCLWQGFAYACRFEYTFAARPVLGGCQFWRWDCTSMTCSAAPSNVLLLIAPTMLELHNDSGGNMGPNVCGKNAGACLQTQA